MAIGKHNPKTARQTDFRKAIAIGLDEAFIALEESFHDLNDAQLTAFPIADRGCIAWIVMHCLQNLDEYTNCSHKQAEKWTFPHEWRWDLWQCREDERPKPGDSYPTTSQMVNWLQSLRATATEFLDSLDAAGLAGKPDDEHWPGNFADMYMRTIYHTMAHVRQIWLLRSALGLTSGGSWRRQHWA